jgi:uncharacterized protein YrrD
MTAGQIIGLPVVTLEGGEDVAEVRDVIYDPGAGSVVGLTLNKRGFLRGRLGEVLPAANIYAIGPDAVVVANESALTAPNDAPADVAAPDEQRNIIGNDVTTESGTVVGTVEDMALIAGGRGEVVGYQINTLTGQARYLPFHLQVSISGTTLLVSDTTVEFLRDDLVGLGAAVDEYRAKLGTA